MAGKEATAVVKVVDITAIITAAEDTLNLIMEIILEVVTVIIINSQTESACKQGPK